MDFYVSASRDGHEIPELEVLLEAQQWEPELWEMCSAVWREMSAGMGRGMMGALLDYCTIKGIDDPRVMRLYHDIMCLAMPKKQKER